MTISCLCNKYLLPLHQNQETNINNNLNKYEYGKVRLFISSNRRCKGLHQR